MQDSESITNLLVENAQLLIKIEQLQQDFEAMQSQCVVMLEQQSDGKASNCSEQQALVAMLRSTAEEMRVVTAQAIWMRVGVRGRGYLFYCQAL